MIKNSILGKLCPVFHLRSAAVASRQNLNHWLVWPGTASSARRRGGAHPGGTSWILRRAGEPQGEGEREEGRAQEGGGHAL